jgi:hypothetical protein
VVLSEGACNGFIKVVGYAVVGPFAARAAGRSRCGESAHLQGPQELGWSEGRNPRIDTGVCFLKQKQ